MNIYKYIAKVDTKKLQNQFTRVSLRGLMSFHGIHIKGFLGRVEVYVLPFNPWEWLASNFSLEYSTPPCFIVRIKEWSPTKEALDFEQILLFSNSGNVQRTVWRICILMLGCTPNSNSYLSTELSPRFDEYHILQAMTINTDPQLPDLYHPPLIST